MFGVPVEQSDGSWLLPENSKKVNWSASETQTMTVNVTSAGDYSVYLLAREYNTRGFSITMSGIKADGTEYEDTYLTNYKNGENTPGISGQTKVGVSVTVNNVNLGVHFAKFKDLAVGKHNLSITYSGDAGKGVDSFFGLNVYQTKEYTGPVVLLEDVGMNNVTLLDEFLLNAESQDIKFLLELEPERFFYNWYRTSGLTPKTTEGYENSWERTKDKNFRGHMFGHYMSALAQSYIASDDESIKSQLLEK